MPFTGNTMWAAPAITPAFGQRPSQASISNNGGTDFTITNKFFDQFVGGPGGEYIELDNYTGTITITDCDFDSVPDGLGSGRRCIYLLGCTGNLVIQRCRARLVPQNFIQLNASHMTGRIQDNKVRGTTVNSEDLISCFRSGGTDGNNRLQIFDNHIDGNDPSGSTPNYTSGSGSGMLLCDSAQDANTGFISCYNNTMLNPGAVGLGVAGGNDVDIDGNMIWSDQTATSNVGMYIWMNGGSVVCANMECSGNRVWWVPSSGSGTNDIFTTGNCGTIVNLSNNVFGDPTLNPANLVVNL